MIETIDTRRQASFEFCRQVARREARNFYMCFMLLPSDLRRSMCSLYAFLRRSDDLVDDAPDVERGRIDLADWRRTTELLLADPASLDGLAHNPVAVSACGLDPDASLAWPGWPALLETIQRHRIPHHLLLEILDGVAMDLEPSRFAQFSDLYNYCYRVASVVGLCCLHIWGYRSEGGRAEELAEACGIALQLTNILRDVREDAGRGRVYLPQEELDRFGVDPADFIEGRLRPETRRLLEYQAHRAVEFYHRAMPLARLVEPVGRPVFRAIVGIYRALLEEIVRRDYEVLAERISVPAWRKLAIAARSMTGWSTEPSLIGSPS